MASANLAGCLGIWNDPAGDEANIRWARGLWNAVRPFSTGGVYANNLGDECDERVRGAYGANYARLAAIEKQYVRLNQNIRPG
ncbi:hypothetical protein MesoLj113b_66600 [Mesorhizobium sp. 113-3-3]|nr:hypothetical protein MesoLj113b_66600 [Mesorhizobium sp. 113-3-3]